MGLTLYEKAAMPSSKAKQLERDLRDSGVDPFLIAAEAIERSERLFAENIRLNKFISNRTPSNYKHG